MTEFIQFLSKKMNDLYNGASGSYKEALEDVTDYVCEYLETRGHQINWTPITENYMTSKKHREIQRFNDLSLEEQIYRFFKEKGEDIDLENIQFNDDIEGLREYYTTIYAFGPGSAFKENQLVYVSNEYEDTAYNALLYKIKNKEKIDICTLNGGCGCCPFEGSRCT